MMIPGTPWFYREWIDKVIFAMIHSLLTTGWRLLGWFQRFVLERQTSYYVQSVNSRVSHWEDTAKTASSNYFYWMLRESPGGPEIPGLFWSWENADTLISWLLIKKLEITSFQDGKRTLLWSLRRPVSRENTGVVIHPGYPDRELWTSLRKGGKILEKCPKRMHKS